MIRKSLSIVILLSLTLHCATRLGTLSFLYKQRHRIDYAIGLIAEIPIAMCTSDYDFDKTLKIESKDTTEATPVSFLHTQEINLFFIASLKIFNEDHVISEVKPTHFYLLSEYSSPSLPFFHPPSLG